MDNCSPSVCIYVVHLNDVLRTMSLEQSFLVLKDLFCCCTCDVSRIIVHRAQTLMLFHWERCLRKNCSTLLIFRAHCTTQAIHRPHQRKSSPFLSLIIDICTKVVLRAKTLVIQHDIFHELNICLKTIISIGG